MFEVTYGPVLIKRVIAGTPGLEEVITLPLVSAQIQVPVRKVGGIPADVASMDEVLTAAGVLDEFTRLAAPPITSVHTGRATGGVYLTKDGNYIRESSNVKIDLAYPNVVYSENSAEHNLYKKFQELAATMHTTAGTPPVTPQLTTPQPVGTPVGYKPYEYTPAGGAEDAYAKWDPSKAKTIAETYPTPPAGQRVVSAEEANLLKSQDAFRQWANTKG